MQYQIATVVHWNGFTIRGLVTGGDGHGIFVQEPNRSPIFCDFSNVRTINFAS